MYILLMAILAAHLACTSLHLLHRRSERCGRCHTCINPQLKQACLTVRARQEAEARAKVTLTTFFSFFYDFEPNFG